MTDSQFFDIDQILAEEEQTTAQIQLDGFYMDSLEQQHLHFMQVLNQNDTKIREETNFEDNLKNPIEDSDIEQKIEEYIDNEDCNKDKVMIRGTKFRCPIWLGIQLFENNFVTLQIPKWFEEDFLNVALAGPIITNLKEKNYNYYIFGHYLNNKLRLRLKDSISQIQFKRLKELIQIIIHSPQNTQPNSFLQKLTSTEEKFYNENKLLMNDYKIWRVLKTITEKRQQVLSGTQKLKKI